MVDGLVGGLVAEGALVGDGANPEGLLVGLDEGFGGG